MAQYSITAPSGTRFASWSRRMRREFIWAYRGQPLIRQNASALRNCSVWRILQGEVDIKSEKSEVTATAGEWVSPGRRFHYSFSEDASIISIHFSCEWTLGRSLIPPELVVKFPASDYPELDDAALQLIHVMPPVRNPTLLALEKITIELSKFLQIDSAFANWLSAWIDIVVKSGTKLTEIPGIRTEVLRAIDFIRRHAPEMNYVEEDIINVAGLSRSTLLSQYVDIVGITPREHFDQIKLEAAQTALEIGDGQLKTLAFELGFKSASQFTNWFRRRTSLSPREYRERSRNMIRT